MKRNRPRLGNVEPQGRVDVLMYRFAERVIDRCEQERGLTGLRDLLPMIEGAILTQIGSPVVPKELLALLRVYDGNRGRGGQTS